jgi:hypothetical protein
LRSPAEKVHSRITPKKPNEINAFPDIQKLSGIKNKVFSNSQIAFFTI